MTSGAEFSAIWTCRRFDCDSGTWLRRTGRLGLLRSDLAASYSRSFWTVRCPREELIPTRSGFKIPATMDYRCHTDAFTSRSSAGRIEGE